MSNRQRLRAKIAEKRMDRQHGIKSRGNYSKGKDEEKVRSFRQQEEFGPKKFIKP